MPLTVGAIPQEKTGRRVFMETQGYRFRRRNGPGQEVPRPHIRTTFPAASSIMAAMSKPTSQSPSLLFLIVPIAALAIFGFFGARYMLNSHVETTMERLAVVWPGVAGMPEPDRAFLVELALTCNVVERKAVRAEVIDCLRSAAGKLHPAPTERLESLVAQQ